ncbi:hypothetical protein ACFV03_25740 [Streptomyces mirabilis]
MIKVAAVVGAAGIVAAKGHAARQEQVQTTFKPKLNRKSEDTVEATTQ